MVENTPTSLFLDLPSEAFSVNNLWATFIVFRFRDPHALKARQ